MRYAFLCCILFFTFLASKSQLIGYGGTAIICYVTKDTIWLAADSKFGSTSKKLSGNHLKIKNVGNTLFSITSNVSAIVDTITGVEIFNSYRVLESCLKKYKSIDSAVMKFNDSVCNKIDSLYKNDHAFKEENINLSLLEAVIVAFKDNKPFWVKTRIGMIRKGNDTCCVSIVIPQKEQIPILFFLGKTDVIEKEIKKPKYDRPDTKNVLIEVIRLQAKADTVLVGEPIDVAILCRNGWKLLTHNKYNHY